jgi:two-component system sensor histidine kinase KdpD
LALVDELAHTNIPGAGRHEKRWEDVLELLESGISVITTVNIQHIESLAEAVESITGVKVRERVPDWVVRKADQIELIDSSPDQLRRRMLHGNIYAPEKVPAALTNFFRIGNLTALRELALRFVADETEEEMQEYLRAQGISELWDTCERIMVGVAPAQGAEHVIRRAARIAARTKADLAAVYVKPDDGLRSDAADRVGELRQLVESVGGVWHEVRSDDVAKALIDFAHDNQITQVVLGSSRRSRVPRITRGSVIHKVLDAVQGTGIDVHVIDRNRG